MARDRDGNYYNPRPVLGHESIVRALQAARDGDRQACLNEVTYQRKGISEYGLPADPADHFKIKWRRRTKNEDRAWDAWKAAAGVAP